MKISVAAILTLAFTACGSAENMTKNNNPKVKEAYYNVYVGGTPEAGLSRSYFMVLDTVHAQQRVAGMQVDGRVLSIEKSASAAEFVGSERFAVKAQMTEPQRLTLLLVEGTDTIKLTANRPEFRETITFPSAPPMD